MLKKKKSFKNLIGYNDDVMMMLNGLKVTRQCLLRLVRTNC